MDVVGGCGGVVCPAGGTAFAPGIPRVLASLARAPFAGSERGGTWWRRAPPCPTAPGIPRSFRSAHSRPLTLKRRGHGGVRPFRADERGANGVSGVCAGMGGVQRGRTVWVSGGRAPRLRPGIPRVLASLARAPFAGSERGRVDSRLRGNDARVGMG